MPSRTRKSTHADNCGWCGDAFDADKNPYYSIVYIFKRKDDILDSGNRYACREKVACMAWAQAHVVKSI